jgi:hypothetical protein
MKHPINTTPIAGGLILSLLTSGLAQSIAGLDEFNQAARGNWPNWIEVMRPACGTQPRVSNGLGFLFVNGCNAESYLWL